MDGKNSFYGCEVVFYLPGEIPEGGEFALVSYFRNKLYFQELTVNIALKTEDVHLYGFFVIFILY